MKIKHSILFCLFAFGWSLFLFSFYLLSLDSADSQEKRLTLIHTNDLHSHFLGHSPNLDYTTETVNDDQTRGGWARIATVIQRERQARDHPVLVLDAGDFLMGTLFHLISREQAVELVLMKEMGFDLSTLGNHEFDLKPHGLSRILRAAQSKGGMPQIIASNLLFDPIEEADDALEQDFKEGLIKPYVVLERSGIRIGFFGIMGANAAEVSPFAWPVTFTDAVETAQRMVSKLREEEKADIVICLSHSGVSDKRKRSEDEILAKKASGIDIIISGHTHTELEEPILINDTIIVQAGSYGKCVGVLDVAVAEDKSVLFENYNLIKINDSIKGDERITELIEAKKAVVEKEVLEEKGLTFYQTLAETSFDLCLENKETGLGNMLTDAIRWAVNKRVYDPERPSSRARIALQSNGLIRSDIVKGKTGIVCVSDLFRTEHLGIGVDGTMSYPLLTFYLYASEIKKAAEVATSIFPIKGGDYFLNFSGIKVSYNPKRMIFDRVTNIMIEEEDGSFVPLNTSSSNKMLYRVTSNFYNSSFIKVVGDFTKNILKIVPKDERGIPIPDLAATRVDANPDTPGLQELKDWETIFEYTQTFKDGDGDGIKEIPHRYSQPEGRYVSESSLNPLKLLKGGSLLTWGAFLGILVVISLVLLIIYVLFKKIKKRRIHRK